MTPVELKSVSKLFFELVPPNGTTIGNKNLIGKLREQIKKQRVGVDLTDDAYWEVRNHLIEEGKIEKGTGYGGTVYRVEDVEARESKPANKKIRESDLYEKVEKYIEKTWVKENGIRDGDFVLERTANQGKKRTGGKWTRPDLALIALRSFPYIPGKDLEIVSFEVKPEDDYRIEGVFETAAHSRFSNKSYLCIYTPNGEDSEKDDFQRVELECKRFGLGLLTFTDPDDWTTYKTIQEAVRRLPDPADMNSFISQQLTKENQSRVLALVK